MGGADRTPSTSLSVRVDDREAAGRALRAVRPRVRNGRRQPVLRAAADRADRSRPPRRVGNREPAAVLHTSGLRSRDLPIRAARGRPRPTPARALDDGDRITGAGALRRRPNVPLVLCRDDARRCHDDLGADPGRIYSRPKRGGFTRPLSRHRCERTSHRDCRRQGCRWSYRRRTRLASGVRDRGSTQRLTRDPHPAPSSGAPTSFADELPGSAALGRLARAATQSAARRDGLWLRLDGELQPPLDRP